MSRGPRGKGKHFPGKKLLTSEGRKPNSVPRASALHAGWSARPAQARWKERAARPSWPQVGREHWAAPHCHRACSSTTERRGQVLATILAHRSPPTETAGEKIAETSSIPIFESPSYSLISLGSEGRSLEVLSSAWSHSLGQQARTSSSQVFTFLCSVPCQGKECSVPPDA